MQRLLLPWQLMFFTWMTPVVFTGYKRALEHSDLVGNPIHRTAEGMYKNYLSTRAELVAAGKPVKSIKSSLWAMFKWRFLFSWLLLCCSEACNLTQPVLIGKLVYVRGRGRRVATPNPLTLPRSPSPARVVRGIAPAAPHRRPAPSFLLQPCFAARSSWRRSIPGPAGRRGRRLVPAFAPASSCWSSPAPSRGCGWPPLLCRFVFTGQCWDGGARGLTPAFPDPHTPPGWLCVRVRVCVSV